MVTREILEMQNPNPETQEILAAVSLEQVLDMYETPRSITTDLSQPERELLFHGTRDRNTHVFVDHGFIGDPGVDTFTHSVFTASNDKWNGGFITTWNPPQELLTAGDRVSMAIENPVPASLVGVHIAESEMRQEFTVTDRMRHIPADYFCGLMSVDNSRLRTALNWIRRGTYYHGFRNFDEMISDLIRVIMKEGEPHELAHWRGPAFDDVIHAAAVKEYESTLKSWAELFLMGHADMHDAPPDYAYPAYSVYKHAKMIARKR